MSELHGPAGPGALEERLRAALRDRGPVGSGGEGSVVPSATKARVLSGIRQRRLRRLQMTGIAAVAVIALAVGIPQALGRSAPPSGPSGVSGSASNEALAPRAAVNAPAAQAATCQVSGEPAGGCGNLATGPAADRLSKAADLHASAATFGAAGASQPFGKELAVKAGTSIVIDLPAVKKKWLWSTPVVVGTRAPSASVAPVIVFGTGKSGSAQQFMVTARHATTVVLEAREDVFGAPRGAHAPMIIPGSAPVWILELKVEGS